MGDSAQRGSHRHRPIWKQHVSSREQKTQSLEAWSTVSQLRFSEFMFQTPSVQRVPGEKADCRASRIINSQEERQGRCLQPGGNSRSLCLPLQRLVAGFSGRCPRCGAQGAWRAAEGLMTCRACVLAPAGAQAAGRTASLALDSGHRQKRAQGCPTPNWPSCVTSPALATSPS